MTARALPRTPLILLTPVLIILCMLWLRNQVMSDMMAMAITVDLVLTMPLIHFFLIKKTRIPWTTVVPIFIIGVVAGTYILPIEHQGLLALVKTYMIPIVELSVLTYVSTKVYKAIKGYKAARVESMDAYDAISQVCSDIAPNYTLAHLLSTELSMIYYLLFSWREKAPSRGYTYHQKTGSVALLGALSFIIVVEVFVMHILLVRWSTVAAWILSILSIYSLLQVISLIRSIYLRPILIDGDALRLRYGFFRESTIDLEDIVEARPLARGAKMDDMEIVNFALLGEMETPNVLIECNRPQTILGPYTIKKESAYIALSVDSRDDFIKEINEKSSSNPL